MGYLQLKVNGENVDWVGDYTDHVYEYYYEGKDSSVHFNIVDDYYGDNSGGLSVSIFEKLY